MELKLNFKITQLLNFQITANRKLPYSHVAVSLIDHFIMSYCALLSFTVEQGCIYHHLCIYPTSTTHCFSLPVSRFEYEYSFIQYCKRASWNHEKIKISLLKEDYLFCFFHHQQILNYTHIANLAELLLLKSFLL